LQTTALRTLPPPSPPSPANDEFQERARHEFPITSALPASNIITMSTGTEMALLITALQKSALMNRSG
jgi:hypothetical protein